MNVGHALTAFCLCVILSPTTKTETSRRWPGFPLRVCLNSRVGQAHPTTFQTASGGLTGREAVVAANRPRRRSKSPPELAAKRGWPVKLVRLRPLLRTRAGARTEAARGNAAANKGGTTESHSRPLRAGVFVCGREA
jgi:hypothetical protein